MTPPSFARCRIFGRVDIEGTRAGNFAKGGRPCVCGQIFHTHKYVALWQDLPKQIQDDILAIGAIRFAGHTDLTDVHRLLRDYEFVFTKVRYEYELYERYSLAEQKQLGDYWVELGTPDNESIVNFHPMELSALLHGLRQVIASAP